MFKAHILSCVKLLEDPENFYDIAKNSDIDQMFVQAVKYNDSTHQVSFNVNWASAGLLKQYPRYANLSALQDLLLKLAEHHPDLDVFKASSDFSSLIFLDAESQINDPQKLIKQVNAIVSKLCQMFVIKQNTLFTKFFGIGDD
jgi:hypothetical protein